VEIRPRAAALANQQAAAARTLAFPLLTVLRRHMASGATAVQPGGASGSAAPLSGADAALLVQLRTRKGAPAALLRAGQAARPTEDEARSGAQAVGAVLQCPALLAAVFVFLEPADLCAVALVCDAWSLVRWRACACFRPHDLGAAWPARAPRGPGLVHLRPGSALARKDAVAEVAVTAGRLLRPGRGCLFRAGVRETRELTFNKESVTTAALPALCSLQT